ncbi:MAG: DNA gyrase inhibitor YacG [Sphingomonadales bacterium]|nr:DNA gyrase inhibitor YacG [Sphingomonadales bacterium]
MSIKGKCPICRKPTVHEFRPFCSRVCRDRDLLNWADESYRVPVAPEEEDSKERGEG